MIVFDNLWKTMSRKGITSYRLKETYGFDSRTLRILRNNHNIQTKTLDRVCRTLDCRIEDVAEYIQEETND